MVYVLLEEHLFCLHGTRVFYTSLILIRNIVSGINVIHTEE